MKKIIFFILIFIMAFSSTALATNVQLNGQIIDFTDSNGNKVEAQIINDRTMVPLRKIFELLGCNVEWEASTQTITATKENKTIILQINNVKAKKIIDGETAEIKLDSAPVIVNDRTLVPLRFIAESLGKQVGWDAVNKTAIIIDYTYFENELKSSAPALYYFLKDNYEKSANTKLTITRKYYDGYDNSNSNTSTVVADIHETKNNNINQRVDLSFSGNSPLMQDIQKEKWDKSSMEIIYNKDNFSYNTSNVLAKMIGESKTISYSELGFNYSGLADLQDGFRDLININEKTINVNTFNEVKAEFKRLCDLFNSTNQSQSVENGTNYTWNFNTVSLVYSNTNFTYFDLTKLDNIIYNNMYVRAFDVINKKIFNYDVKHDELMYDTNDIKLNGNISVVVNGGKLVNTNANIIYKASSEYSEQFEYNIRINM